MNQVLRLLPFASLKANGDGSRSGAEYASMIESADVVEIKRQGWPYLAFYVVFGLMSLGLMIYYLSNTIIHYTTGQQFPINSFQRFPLTFLIFPAEVFSFCFGMYFVYLLVSGARKGLPPKPLRRAMSGKVALLVPVYNEPSEIVERTVAACKRVRWWRGTSVYILDDSTEKQHVDAMASLGRKYGCHVVRRPDRVGYKAGNVNNAVANVIREPYFAIFDADQAPLPEFLEESMDYFSDSTVAFVQAPQHYVNANTPLEKAARMGTGLFFQAQCSSKAKDGAMPFCGTNAVIRADVFRAVRGFSYYTSTEDVELGLRMNDAGYQGAFVPKVLVHGYAPPDFVAYSSQQYRWANGNLAILRENWLRILSGNLSLKQQVHTFFTLGWWLVGIVSLIYIAVPLLSLFLNTGTHHTWLPNALLLLLYLNVSMGMILVYIALRNRTGEPVRFTDTLLQYSLIVNSAFIYARAAIGAFLKRYIGFVRTNKAGSSSGWRHIAGNMALSGICFSASIYALFRSASAVSPEEIRAFVPISLWLLFYSVVFASSMLFIGAKPASVALPVKSPHAGISLAGARPSNGGVPNAA